jgi:hypothetical protein
MENIQLFIYFHLLYKFEQPKKYGEKVQLFFKNLLDSILNI